MDIIMIDKDLEYCESLKNFLKANGDMNIVEIFTNFTEAKKYFESGINNFELIIMDISSLSMQDLENMLDILPSKCNIIALTDDMSNMAEYINFPYFQRIFQKPVSFSSISSYISTQNGIETYENIRRKVLKRLSQAGFNLKHVGTTYLADGVMFALKNKAKKLSEIYTFIAFKYNTEPRIITWSINNAINKATKNFTSVLENKNADMTLSKNKVTAKFIINYLVNCDY